MTKWLWLVVLWVWPQIGFADFSGRLRLEEQSFVQPPSPSVPQTETSLNLEIEEFNNWNDHWGFRLEPKIRISSIPREADTAWGNELHGTSWDWDFRDTYIEGKAGTARWQFGSFQKIWEGTDGVNPMDIASMKNLRDPFSGETLGSWGVSMSWGEGLITWDMIFVPWQTLPRLPGDNSAWLPRHASLPLEADNEQLLISPNPIYQILPHAQLDNAWSDNRGGRMQIHGSNWDLSFAFFEGASQIPVFRPYIQGQLVETDPKFIVQMDNPIQVQPVDYRRRTISSGLVYTKDTWIYRVAARHEQPLGDDPILPGWWDQSVVGVEKTLAVGEQSLIFSVLYTFERYADQTQSVLASPDPFEASLMTGVRWPISDDWLFTWMGLWDTKYGSKLERLSLQRKLGDHWSAEVAADWYHGADDTLLGLWSEQSRGHVAGIYGF